MRPGRVKIEADRVYLYRTEIQAVEAPFGRYQTLAREALSRLDLPLPETGALLLKANATVLYAPETRIITHPGFLAGMLDTLVEDGVAADRLSVGDGQSGEHPERGFSWAVAGYREMLDARGVALAALDGTETVSVPVPDGVVYSAYPVFRAVRDCGFFFNVPVAKCHNLGCTTLAVKNLMGILGRPERHLCGIQEVDKPVAEGIWRLGKRGISRFEERFCHKLCDLVAALRSLNVPRLCVVDGLIGRDGTAFNEGENAPLGWTLMGKNEIHVDAVGTYLMGLDPEETPYLKCAARRGLGTHRVADLEVVDLATGAVMTAAELQAARSPEVLMPVARCKEGYYNRFREDGTVVPWRIDAVNEQREADGLAAIPVG